MGKVVAFIPPFNLLHWAVWGHDGLNTTQLILWFGIPIAGNVLYWIFIAYKEKKIDVNESKTLGIIKEYNDTIDKLRALN